MWFVLSHYDCSYWLLSNRNVHLISPVFLKRSLVFPFCCFPLLFWIVHLRRPSYLSLLICGILHSLGYVFPSPLLFTSLLSSAICNAPRTTALPSSISCSLGWFWSLLPLQCYKSPFIVLQALCLSDLTPWICSSPPLYNHKRFALGHTCLA